MSRSLILGNANVIRADGSWEHGRDVLIRNGVIEGVLGAKEGESLTDRKSVV